MSKKNRNRAQAIPAEVETVEEVVSVEAAPEEVVLEEAVEVPEVQEEIIPEELPEIEEGPAIEEEPAPEEQVVEEVKEQPVVEEIKKEVPQEKPVERVIKPIEGVLKVEKRAVPASAVISIPQTEGVLKFNAIANKYLEIMKSGKIDDESRRRALITLSNMANHVCMTADPAVFDTCFRFFMENRSIMLAQSTVVSGIEKAVEKSKIAKILQFYTVFQTLVECKLLGSRFTLNVTTVRRLLNNDALANWLIAKRG